MNLRTTADPGIFPAMGRLRVMLNDRCLRNKQTGVGHYVAQLIAGIRQQAPDIDLLPFYSHWFRGGQDDDGSQSGATKTSLQAAEGSSSTPEPSGLSAPPRKKKRLPWQPGSPIRPVPGPQFRATPPPPARWPDWLRQTAQSLYEATFEAAGSCAGYTLYHEPNHIPGPWHGPVVTTIHDLSVLRHPEWHPADRVAWYEGQFEAAMPRTSHFIAVSEFTRQEMIKILGIPRSRITTIYNGVREVFHPRKPEKVRAWLADRGLPQQYVLFAGTIEPRKNLGGLLEAYAELPAPLQREFPLLIVGMTGWMRESLAGLLQLRRLENSTYVLGYVTERELARLYCGARLLVWPSFYEGFGLPPLEAMASGTAVITSATASMPEVVADAGLLVEPQNPWQIREAIRRLLEDDDLCEELADRGLRRSHFFSWLQSAAEHAEVYRRVAAEYV